MSLEACLCVIFNRNHGDHTHGLLDSFLTSPIVELIVGSGDKKTAMTAHQSLLLESPLLSEQVKAFGEGPVGGTLFPVW